MAKRRGEQKQIVKKRTAQREAAITPAKWFNIIVTALLIGVILMVAFGYLKQYM